MAIALVSGPKRLGVKVYAFSTTKEWIYFPQLCVAGKGRQRLLDHARDEVARMGQPSSSSKKIP
ncbi:hypothetical protein OC861_006599, partial [Tilletia horrida]